MHSCAVFYNFFSFIEPINLLYLGRPILNYIVQMKDKLLVDWLDVLETKDADCKAVVGGLKEKQTYQFRVIAVNKAGKSQPSEPTANHLCKHRFLKPVIDRNTFKTITIKAGRTHKWAVDVSGEPGLLLHISVHN